MTHIVAFAARTVRAYVRTYYVFETQFKIVAISKKKSTMAVGRNVFIESAVRAVMQHLSVGSPCRDNFLLVCSSIASSYLNN